MSKGSRSKSQKSSCVQNREIKTDLPFEIGLRWGRIAPKSPIYVLEWECQVATTGFEPVTKGLCGGFFRFSETVPERAIQPLSPVRSFQVSVGVISTDESTLVEFLQPHLYGTART